MRFKGLDLNLLVALDALLAERNVSRAADRLGMSQPAASAALARLRAFFADDLLAQHGKKMFPTPYAEGLAAQLREFLHAADTLIATSALFVPAATERLFRIVASDYAAVSVLSPLIARLAGEAPGLSFELVPSDEIATAALMAGKADLLLVPEEFANPGLLGELLFEERHVVVGCRDNPLFEADVTEERMLACGQVAVQLGPTRRPTFADMHLARLGKARRVEVYAGSFTSVPWLLLGTRRVAVMHERLARDMAQRFPIRFAPLPFAFPIMREMMMWHPVREADEGLRWLRTEIKAQAAAGGSIHFVDE